jgi:DNA-binding transcriptional regulator YiaG
MTSLERQPAFGPTSAAGAMRARPAREPVLVSCFMLAGLGTSTVSAVPLDVVFGSVPAIEQTTAGATVHVAESAAASIGELRRLSGFTWEQLARLFNVSRRSLHFWASGKPMAAGNEEHLQRLLDVIRKIDRGSANANRKALLTARGDVGLPFDLLVDRNYDQVARMLGPTTAERGSAPKITNEARAARAPRPPAELVGALQDRVHPTSGRLLKSKPLRLPRRT